MFNLGLSELLQPLSEDHVLLTCIFYQLLPFLVLILYFFVMLFFDHVYRHQELVPHSLKLLLHNFGFIFLSLLLLFNELLLKKHSLLLLIKINHCDRLRPLMLLVSLVLLLLDYLVEWNAAFVPE